MGRIGRWQPIPGARPVLFTGTHPRKGVIHRTQCKPSNDYRRIYAPPSGPPTWSVSSIETAQHFETDVGSRALKNLSGGVETNSANVLQIEVFGYSGTDMDDLSLTRLVEVLKHCRDHEGIPWVWPSGRPRRAAYHNGEPLDPGGHNRSLLNWLTRSGWYDHGSVPENVHWDPAFTDRDWYLLNAAMAPAATAAVTATWKVQPMWNPPCQAVAGCEAPEGGAWLVTDDGAVFTVPPAPFLGGMNGDPDFVNRHAASIRALGPKNSDGYEITATSTETYVPRNPWGARGS